MTTDLARRLAIYPMVEEADATGSVSAVYGQILSRMPLVPSLFKSFAVCPTYLVLAWRQAAPVLDAEDFVDAAQRLRSSVENVVSPPPDAQVRSTLARFVDPLAKMLLLSAGLYVALDSDLGGEPAASDPPAWQDATASRPAPSQWQADADELFGRIRAALKTPIINSIWRELAGHGQLEHAWMHLEPQVATIHDRADGLQSDALDAARTLHWRVVADRRAVRAAGIEDAAPGMAAVLDAYVKTLPRVLVLAASSAS